MAKATTKKAEKAAESEQKPEAAAAPAATEAEAPKLDPETRLAKLEAWARGQGAPL
jgi:hypothetical protein